MSRVLPLVVIVMFACAPPPAASVTPSATEPPPPVTVTVRPTTAPLPTLPVRAQALRDVPGRGVASPDGKWIAAPEPAPGGKVPYVPALLMFDTAGTRVTKIEAPGGAYSWSWLADSSGLYIALDTPQRAATLGIAELDGRVTKTGLQFAHPLLTRDGKWIVAEHQDGCCVAIEQKEIWIAPRAGGAPRVLARTSTTDRPQPIVLLGLDWQDRVVYRDGDTIRRVPLGGGAPTTLASGTEFATTLMGDVSPDGFAMVIRGYDPARWYAVRDDVVFPWNDLLWGTIVEDRQGATKLFGTRPIWYDGHTLLVSFPKGLFIRSIGEGNNAELLAKLAPGDAALARSGTRLLVARGTRAVVVELMSGREGDVGIDLGTDTFGALASALPSGGFILSTPFATYRVD